MFRKLLIIAPFFVLTACSNNIAYQQDQDEDKLNQLIAAQLKTNKPHQYSAIMDKRLSKVLSGVGRHPLSSRWFNEKRN